MGHIIWRIFKGGGEKLLSNPIEQNIVNLLHRKSLHIEIFEIFRITSKVNSRHSKNICYKRANRN